MMQKEIRSRDLENNLRAVLPGHLEPTPVAGSCQPARLAILLFCAQLTLHHGHHAHHHAAHHKAEGRSYLQGVDARYGIKSHTHHYGVENLKPQVAVHILKQSNFW